MVNYKVLKSIAVTFLLIASISSAVADPLQGSIQQLDDLSRSNQASPLQGRAALDELNRLNSAIEDSQFLPIEQRAKDDPSRSNMQFGTVPGGQDEYNVNWDAWRHRIAYAVWEPLRGTMMWGQTYADYYVSRDGHIQIAFVSTPDPTRASAVQLVNAITRLEGTPILEFPPGSKQTLHPNRNMAVGPPRPSRLGALLHVPGGNEHVIRQW